MTGPAPLFSAPSTADTSVSLESFRGQCNVLLAFFPLAFTSTCTAELCEFTEDYLQFEELGVTVLPISVDSVPTLKEYRNKYSMKTHLLSDFRRDICKKYGVYNDEKFYANRAYFLIDRHGQLRWQHIEGVSKEKRSTAELVEQIRKIDAR